MHITLRTVVDSPIEDVV